MDGLEQLTIFDTPSNITPGAEDLSLVLKEEVVLAEIAVTTKETHYIEIEQELMPYEIGDSVQVDPDNLDENDVLNYNYLLDFLKKKGIVTKVIHKPTLQYEVAYGDMMASMYHKDLTI